jgi:hypothetical protein
LAPVRTTLVTGASSGLREGAVGAAIAALPEGQACAALLEGLPDGRSQLVASTTLDLRRVAPACLCCTGNLVLRVTLNRILQRHPESLFIGVANTDHIDQLRSWLQHPPYDQLLVLTPDLPAS